MISSGGLSEPQFGQSLITLFTLVPYFSLMTHVECAVRFVSFGA